MKTVQERHSMFKGLKSLIMTTAACAAMAGAAGAAAPALPQAVHTVEGIKSYELANGLKVIGCSAPEKM